MVGLGVVALQDASYEALAWMMVVIVLASAVVAVVVVVVSLKAEVAPTSKTNSHEVSGSLCLSF